MNTAASQAWGRSPGSPAPASHETPGLACALEQPPYQLRLRPGLPARRVRRSPRRAPRSRPPARSRPASGCLAKGEAVDHHHPAGTRLGGKRASRDLERLLQGHPAWRRRPGGGRCAPPSPHPLPPRSPDRAARSVSLGKALRIGAFSRTARRPAQAGCGHGAECDPVSSMFIR